MQQPMWAVVCSVGSSAVAAGFTINDATGQPKDMLADWHATVGGKCDVHTDCILSQAKVVQTASLTCLA